MTVAYTCSNMYHTHITFSRPNELTVPYHFSQPNKALYLITSVDPISQLYLITFS